MSTVQIEVFGNIYEHSFLDSDSIDDNAFVSSSLSPSEIQLRDYQIQAYEACLKDLKTHRSSLLVLATGLGKTILFSKIIQNWKGRVLVLTHLEELLQNAYQEIEAITGEILGIERQKDRENGERIVVALIHTLSHTYTRFPPNFFSLIIVDEVHHAASSVYTRVLDYFTNAKVIGLTATDLRADGKRLPLDVCSYRMGIKEGIEQGYLVPIRGRRIIIDSVNLTRVKQTGSGDFDDKALDDEMVKGASAIADVICNDYSFDKGILFFPGCASAKLTSELLNKRISGVSVYVDGKIVGRERRSLVQRLREGSANWLCNVGIATEGFNWPEASVIGMCAPTTSRTAYVQKVGRGTRPLAGLLNGCVTPISRIESIRSSTKPYMTILDFVGISANLNLISAESFLEPITNDKQEERTRAKIDDDGQEGDREESEGAEDESISVNLGISRIVSGIQSETHHSTEEFDPFEASGEFQESVKLKSSTISNELLSEKQYNLLKRWGIDDATLTKKQAQSIVGFIASVGFRMSAADKQIARKLYNDVKASSNHADNDS